MPTAFIESVVKRKGISKQAAEKAWEKAKIIAGKKFKEGDKAFWPYVTAICKTMLGLSEADTRLLLWTQSNSPAWFDKMSNQEQKVYINKHPSTKLKTTFKPLDADHTHTIVNRFFSKSFGDDKQAKQWHQSLHNSLLKRGFRTTYNNAQGDWEYRKGRHRIAVTTTAPSDKQVAINIMHTHSLSGEKQ